MTMGPPQAEEALRECLALGADRAIHLSDRVFAVADTIGTSRTLALAIRKEGADVVLCGRKALDSETWQVPPQVAAFLGWPHVTNVSAIEHSAGSLRLTRETDFGEEVFEAPLPLVVSIGREPDEPTTGDPQGAIEVWQASDLVDDLRPNDKRFGQTGSPTRVLAVRDSRPERAGIQAASPDGSGDADPRAPRRARTGGAQLGEAGPHRRRAWRELRLLERRRARRRAAPPSLAGADRPQPRPRRQARRARGRAAHRA